MTTTDPDATAGPIGDPVRALVREGADLYNRGAFWEAHEAWEDAWHSLKDEGKPALADLLQGLILATAAFENLRRGKPRGFATQGAKALTRFRRHEGLGAQLGLEDEAGFYEAFLEAYLAVQRGKIDRLDDERVEAPPLKVET